MVGSWGSLYQCLNLMFGTVQGAVLHRFRDVLGTDGVKALQVRDRAGDFEDAVVRAGAEVEVVHRHAQEVFGVGSSAHVVNWQKGHTKPSVKHKAGVASLLGIAPSKIASL